MTFAELDRIDMWVIDKEKGRIRLLIFDHMSWDEKDGTAYLDEEHHLRLLQDKIWLYLNFVQDGEIYDKVPDANGLDIVIDVVTKYPPSEIAKTFFSQIRHVVEEEHCSFQVRHSPVEE